MVANRRVGKTARVVDEADVVSGVSSALGLGGGVGNGTASVVVGGVDTSVVAGALELGLVVAGASVVGVVNGVGVALSVQAPPT